MIAIHTDTSLPWQEKKKKKRKDTFKYHLFCLKSAKLIENYHH